MASQLSFTGFAWKNLWRRRLRTLLTLGGITMAIGAFVALVGFSRAFEHEWLRMYQSAGTDIAVVETSFLNTSLDESLGAKLNTIPDVAQAAPMIFNLMDLTPGVNALVYGWRADSYELDSLTLLSGRRFRDGQPEAMLGKFLADSLHKKPSDSLPIQGTTFTVTGVYHGGTALEAGAVIMPLEQLQIISSMEGKVTAFHVRLRPPPPGELQDEYVKSAEVEIEAALPGVRPVPAAQRAANNQLVELAHSVAWGTSSIALLMGILGIANTMAMSVFERTREIGILRAGLEGMARHPAHSYRGDDSGFGWRPPRRRHGMGRSAFALHLAADREHCFCFRLAHSFIAVASHSCRFRTCRRGLSRLAWRAPFAGGGVAL
jgi:putative ABC transport system permease protein